MPNLLRDTVQGVISAAGHVLWYVEWQMAGDRAARPAVRRAGA